MVLLPPLVVLRRFREAQRLRGSTTSDDPCKSACVRFRPPRCSAAPHPLYLALEYEAVCREPEQRIASGLSEPEVETVVTALCAVAQPVETRFLWRPQLHDPADEMVLEAAINGAADALVSFNRQDFGPVPARFGIALLSPQEALRRLSP